MEIQPVDGVSLRPRSAVQRHDVATVTGAQELVEISISPEVVDPDDVEMLQDLVVAAVRQQRVDVQRAWTA